MRPIRSGCAVLAAIFATLSCSDPAAPPQPASLTVVSGNTQEGPAGELLAERVVVEVRDARDRPLRGVAVSWSVYSGNGALVDVGDETDGAGRSTVQWRLGPVAGENLLRVSVADVPAVAVTAVGRPGAPAQAVAIAGDGQAGAVSAPLPMPNVVRVTDAHGNGVAAVRVAFTPSAGTAAPDTALTGANGVAVTAWTLGPAVGEHTLGASVEGLPPLVFRASAFDPQEIPQLQNEVATEPMDAAEGTFTYFRIEVPASVTRLRITTTGGPGDADLFVRHGQLPTLSANDCRSTSPQAAESCTLQGPSAGTWYVMVHAWSAYTGVAVTGAYVVGGSLSVDVAGVTQGLADLTVTGPDNYLRALTASTELTGIDPGTYVVTADFVQRGDTVYTPAEARQEVVVPPGGADTVRVAYAAATGDLDLDIPAAFITQSVQRRDGSVPLIAGRDGLLRVFVRGNMPNSARPALRARFYHGGTLVDTRTIAATASSTPIDPDEARLETTWNYRVPAALVQPGLAVLLDVDPANAFAEGDEANNTFPASGEPLALDVRPASAFEATLVPVLQTGNSLQGDVTTGNLESYVGLTRAVYPLAAMDVAVRAPYAFQGVLASSYDSTWNRLLGEMRALQQAEGDGRYYYGVIKPSYSRGGTGYGYIGFPAAVGVDWQNLRAEVLAHEWGHNFGRFHVDCGGPANPDPDYPYDFGRIAHPGWDIRTGELHDATGRHDLMSYCNPTWSSDYTYEAVMHYRAEEAAAAAAAEPALIVWGRIGDDGAVLEPAFETVTRPRLPTGGGRYRLALRAADGATLTELHFDGDPVDHAPGVRHFTFAIPLRMLRGRMPAAMELRGVGADVRRQQTQAVGAPDVRVTRVAGGAVRLQWDAAASPLAVIRDPASGAILALARTGDALVQTGARELDIELSNGVRRQARRKVLTR